MALHDKSQGLARCGETYGPPWWRGPPDGSSRVQEAGGGGLCGGREVALEAVSRHGPGVTPRQALLGPRQRNACCQAAHWNRGGLLERLLLLSTNFLARWSRSNLSGPAHTDALCHSIKQNVLLVSRHIKEVTGKVNLTLNAPAAVIPSQMC